MSCLVCALLLVFAAVVYAVGLGLINELICGVRLIESGKTLTMPCSNNIVQNRIRAEFAALACKRDWTGVLNFDGKQLGTLDEVIVPYT